MRDLNDDAIATRSGSHPRKRGPCSALRRTPGEPPAFGLARNRALDVGK